MSHDHFRSSLIYRIKEERTKRQYNNSFKKQIEADGQDKVEFYINYQEYDKIRQKNKYRITSNFNQAKQSRENVQFIPLSRKLQERKDTKVYKNGIMPKKISVNFQYFNSKRKRSKEQVIENNRGISFQEILLMSNQKYLIKIDKQNKKKNQRCRMLCNFGLNIKTMEMSEQNQRATKKTESLIRQTSSKDSSEARILTQTADKKIKPPGNNSPPKKPLFSKDKSNSFVIQRLNNIQRINLHQKMQNMIQSYNIILSSFCCYIDPVQNIKESKLKYYVGKGNNKNLIISTLKKRWWWVETNDINNANLVWTQLKHLPTLQRLELSDMTTVILPQDSCIKQVQSTSIIKGFQFSNLWNMKLNRQNKNGVFSDRNHLIKGIKIPECSHNHFSHNFMVGNKNALFQNLTQYYSYKDKDVNSIIPLTFFVDSIGSVKFQQFQAKAALVKQAIWIVKPGENSNRGKGIFVSSSIEQIKSKLSKKNKKHTYIIQKYLTNLFLYQRRKFDIRAYVLLVSIRGIQKFFWYNEGYIRTSSQIFDIKNLSDTYIHLTNDAVQIKSTNYGKFQNGNKISYKQFQHYLDNNFFQQKYFIHNLNQEMKKIAVQAVRSTYHKLDPQPKSYGFQLFGLDFIVDSSFKPWLIQINTNPCLQLTSPVLERVIPRMIQNLFRIAIDPVLQPRQDPVRSRSYYMYENCLQKNRFELIFDSLFDRDLSWQQYSRNIKQKAYQEDNVVFQEDGVEVTIDY